MCVSLSYLNSERIDTTPESKLLNDISLLYAITSYTRYMIYRIYARPLSSGIPWLPWVHFYQFMDQWNHFPRTSSIFRWNPFSEIFAASAKKCRFLAKKLGNIVQKISIFWNSIKTIKIHFLSKLWVIFGPFLGILWSFFSHFWPISPYLTIGRMGVFSHDFPYIGSNIS